MDWSNPIMSLVLGLIIWIMMFTCSQGNLVIPAPLRLICAAACDVYCLQHNPQQFRNLFITERRNSVSLSVQMWDTLCPTGIHPPFFWYVGNRGNPYTCLIVLFSFQELWVAKSGFSKPWSRFLKSRYVYMHKFKKGYFKNPMSSLLQRNLLECVHFFFCIMTLKHTFQLHKAKFSLSHEQRCTNKQNRISTRRRLGSQTLSSTSVSPHFSLW